MPSSKIVIAYLQTRGRNYTKAREIVEATGLSHQQVYGVFKNHSPRFEKPLGEAKYRLKEGLVNGSH